MDIGKRIAQLRGRMPREEFVEGLDIHPQTLYKYEKGKRQPELSTVQTLCNKYDVSADWLIFGIEPKHRDSLVNSVLQESKKEDLESRLYAANDRLYKAMQENSDILRENGDLKVENAALQAENAELRRLSLSTGTDGESPLANTA